MSRFIRRSSANLTSQWPEPRPSDWPDPIGVHARHGLAGEILSAIEPHSEADPAALLIQFLTAFGNIIGRSACFLVESTSHHTNLFAIIVGETAKSRKGTSWGRIHALYKEIDSEWATRRVTSGLSTGEGLIWHVRDAGGKKRPPAPKKGNGWFNLPAPTDEGVNDKRLLVTEEEFSLVLRVIERQGATLSPVIRDAWDSGNLSSLTKNSPGRATGAHISIVGHITRQELLRYLTETESGNGFGNRFLWLCARRSKCLPDGGALNLKTLEPILKRLRDAISFARSTEGLRRDRNAQKRWHEVYPQLTEAPLGLLGSMTSRAEAQVLRLSMIYALLDRSSLIRIEHLEAALAVWTYCAASALYIFDDAIGLPDADLILEALRQHPAGLTRTQISACLGRHRDANQIENALQSLKNGGLAVASRIETEGRYAEKWRVVNTDGKEAKDGS